MLDLLIFKDPAYIIIFSSTILLYYLVIYLWKRRYIYYYSLKLHGPSGWPIIGIGLNFIGDGQDIFSYIQHHFQIYKSPSKVWFGNSLLITLSSPKDYDILLNKEYTKMNLYKFFLPALGDGLITAKLEKWRYHRKLIQPTFNQKILNNFVIIFAEQSNILVQELDQYVGKGFIDIYPIFNKFSLNIICETAMGNQSLSQQERLVYFDWITRGLEIIEERIFHIWQHPEFLWNWFAVSKEFLKIGKDMREFVRSIIVKKRQEYKMKQKFINPDGDINADERKPRLKAFLDYMIEISSNIENFTDNDLITETATLIATGSDTTAVTSSFVMLMLGIYPHIQDKIYEELYLIFGASNRNVELDDLSKMVYLERVIKETMRLFPTVPVIARKITEDIQLDSCMLPKGCSCLLGIFHTHRDPEIWTDPLIFNPDRFLLEEVVKRHPYSYIPFSAGPRICIGFKYAMMALKVELATVLHSYKISTNYKNISDIQLKHSIVLKAVNGFNIALERRN